MQVSSECALEACWALSNLASSESAVALTVADESLLKTLLQLFASPDGRVREHAVAAVANIAGDGVEGRDAVLAAEGLPVLRMIVFSADADLLADALWALVFIADGSEAG